MLRSTSLHAYMCRSTCLGFYAMFSYVLFLSLLYVDVKVTYSHACTMLLATRLCFLPCFMPRSISVHVYVLGFVFYHVHVLNFYMFVCTFLCLYAQTYVFTCLCAQIYVSTCLCAWIFVLYMIYVLVRSMPCLCV